MDSTKSVEELELSTLGGEDRAPDFARFFLFFFIFGYGYVIGQGSLLLCVCVTGGSRLTK